MPPRQAQLTADENLPRGFFYDKGNAGVAGSIQSGYFVVDEAIGKGDKTEIRTFDREPEAGGSKRRDHFLLDIPGRPITRDEPAFQKLLQILQRLAETHPGTKANSLNKGALPYMDGSEAWGRFHYASGWCSDDRTEDIDRNPVLDRNGHVQQVDSRCKRCVQHGLPCISRAFVDTEGKLQVYHQ